MRILHIASEHPPQKVFGLGRYVCDLSRELARQGHEVHVLTNSIGGKDEDVVSHGVHVHRVKFPPPPKPPTPNAPVFAFNLQLQQKAAELTRAGLGNPELLVSHDWLTAIAAHRIGMRWGLPHAWTVHDTIHGKRFGRLESEEDRLIFEIERWASRMSGQVIVNSRSVKREVQELFEVPSNKLHILHCAIDPKLFSKEVDHERLKAFRSVIAPPKDLLITYAGRLSLEKGLDTLINAFAIFLQDFPTAKLAIAGSGSLRETIEGHIAKLGISGSVALYGYLCAEVMQYFYAASDIHVCPSTYEPFGLVAAEAMASAAPTIVSATGGLQEIVSSPSVGLTFPPGNPQALAEQILALARNPDVRRRVGASGAKHIAAKFSWERMARNAVAIYKQACA